MVARIVSGKSIRGILNYNENKIRNAEAELIMAASFPRNAEELSFKNKLERFEMLTRQNSDTKTNALHITLNFSRNDTVDSELLKSIAQDYMDRIGFGSQPFLVYRHYDAAHPHIHIATVNIADGGERIKTHNIGRNQSEKARKEMEIFYGLIRAEDQQKEANYQLRPAKLKEIVYGKSETKSAISSIVREVTGSYKFTSLAELNAVLRQFNILANPGAEGSVMREKGGLLYCLLNEKGETVGVPIKASSIYSSPTLKNLEKKYPANETARRPYGQRLKHQLDKAVSGTGNLARMEELLKAQGIRILMRKNAMGSVYGITFIDNATRVVFNGSDLGKAYSAKPFTEKLERAFGIDIRSDMMLRQEDTRLGTSEKDTAYPAQDQPVFMVASDHALRKGGEREKPTQGKKNRKRLYPE